MRAALVSIAALSLSAAPVWKAPPELPFGKLSVLVLLEDDPTRPPLPRPGDDRLGPLLLRAAEPTPDGRGWRLTVQPLQPGVARIPALDLGDGRRTPELRLTIPRTTPYGAPWVGLGGGQEDVLPQVPFPLAWASLLLLPLALLGLGLLRLVRSGGPHRRLRAAQRTFAHHWPPASSARERLDAGHTSGRDLLAARFGEEARAWGAAELRQHGLPAWALWNESLDAARFGRAEPPFPPLGDLLGGLARTDPPRVGR
jgi:hypothetical protein